MVLLRDYILAIDDYHFKNDAHKDCKIGHASRIYLFFQLRQDFDRNNCVADQHDRDYTYCLVSESYIPCAIR